MSLNIKKKSIIFLHEKFFFLGVGVHVCVPLPCDFHNEGKRLFPLRLKRLVFIMQSNVFFVRLTLNY